jgi:hypothetical protein
VFEGLLVGTADDVVAFGLKLLLGLLFCCFRGFARGVSAALGLLGRLACLELTLEASGQLLDLRARSVFGLAHCLGQRGPR